MNAAGDPAVADEPTPEAETLARPYRSKKQKPCDACRIRRTGCIVEATALKCSLCQHRGIPCTFLSKPVRKRERQAQPHQARSNSSAETMQQDRIAFALTMPALSSTPLLRLRSSIDTSQTNSVGVPHEDTTAMLSGYTSLYSGASGDQDPNLLRHLNFDKNDHFSHASWTVWKVLPRASNPVYFTLFSNDLMDQHTDMYNTESIDNIVGPHQAQLLDLYYTHVHHSYLILEPRQELERRIKEKSIRLSLLTCIYCIAMAFQDSLEGVNKEKRYDLCMFAFSILNIEARAPNLDVIKAFLLYMHILPALVREPNRPGDWALTCQLVGVAQDIGLHRDPSDWNIPTQERKTRRILWWALFIHEKWTAHWLGRPSHIRNTDWDVKPLSLDDFSDDACRLDLNCLASAETFIALASLSEILGDILETFYSVCNDFSVMDAFHANIEGERLRNRWFNWEATTRVGHLNAMGKANVYTLQIARYMVNLSILRARFGSRGGDSEDISLEMSTTIEGLIQLLENIYDTRPVGLWLSYTKGNLQIVGSMIITLLLASLDDSTMMQRRDLLFRYRHALTALASLESNLSDVAKSPLVRLNLICEPLFGMSS